MMKKQVIAIDGDGVLLDFNQSYANLWEKFSGKRPVERDPQAYWHFDRWEIDHLSGEPLARFRTYFDEEFWSNINPLDGAIEACHLLHDAGYELVCVTALTESFENARLKNLRKKGFPIESVVATGNAIGASSPKKPAIKSLKPVAFVDDFLPYFLGIDNVHCALITREPNGSPNIFMEGDKIHSSHVNLHDFSKWWLNKS